MARSKIYQATAQTSATFNGDPPYIFAPAKQGGVTVRCDNWGNTDNTLVVDVYWGEKTLGILPNVATMTWAKDTNLTTTIPATGGTTTEVVGFIKVPQMASKFMRLGFTLAGTSKTVDVVAWFNWQSR